MNAAAAAKRLGGRKPTLRQRLWDAMRVERSFARADLLRLALAGAATPGNMRGAQEYLTALHRAGHLRILRQGKGTGRGGVQTRYLLHRNTGPAAPRYGKRTGVVYDPNTGQEHNARKETA